MKFSALILLAGMLTAQEPGPQLTELEATKLQLNLTQQQLVQQQYNIIVTQIEEAHPGYMLNPITRQLVKKPEPQKPTAPVASPKPEVKKPS